MRDVPLGEWSSSVLALREEGFASSTSSRPSTRPTRQADPGFDLVCHLIDPSQPGALRSVLLRTRAADGVAVPSLTTLFAGAAWHERETHEMFGLDFDGFDDGSGRGLRPLLLPEGFEGTPLRKSFVLAARASKPWPGGKEPGEGHESARAPGRRRVQAPGVPGPDWGPRRPRRCRCRRPMTPLTR